MKFRLVKEKIEGFSDPVKKAEWNNDWAWWGLFGAVIIMEVLAILKMAGKI